MFRHVTQLLGSKSHQAFPISTEQLRSISWRAGQGDGAFEEDITAARKWASQLNESTLPRARVRFDRSSGKGGQHVNTTSSKATCTWEMKSMAHHVPEILHQELRKSSYYAHASDSLVIQAQTSRSQNDNERECYAKLHRLLREASKRVIPGETSPEQKKKVDHMQKADNESRLRMKKQHSSKKQSRRGGNQGDY